MTDRDLLMEQYEDATFAILMDDYIRDESARLREQNRVLTEDPAHALPDEVLSRCLQCVREAFRARRRAASRRKRAKLLRILPVAVVIALALFTIAFAASPALQDKVFQIFRSESETNVTLDLRAADEPPAELPLEAGSFVLEVPDGLVLVDSIEQELIYSQEYRSADGMSFIFDAVRGENVSMSRDQENFMLRKTVTVRGEPVDLLEDESGNYAAMLCVGSDLNYPFLVFTLSENMDEDTFVQILNSLEFQKRDG